MITVLACATAAPDSAAPPAPGAPRQWSMTGFESVYSELDGVALCDAEIALTGTPYTGTCEECDWAITVETEILRDDGGADCFLHPLATLLGSDEAAPLRYRDLFLAHAESWYGDYYDYPDALFVGYGLWYGDVDYPGPYYALLAWDGSPYGTFSQSGNDIAWTLRYESSYDDEVLAYYQDCGDVTDAEPAEPAAGASAEGEVDCAGTTSDVWSFEVGDAPMSITLDTVSEKTTSDLRFYLNAPDGCTLAWADGAPCSFGTNTCASAEIAGEPGTWTVVVGSAGSCAGDVGGYALSVSAPDIVLDADDAPWTVPVAHAFSLVVAGSGTLSEN